MCLTLLRPPRTSRPRTVDLDSSNSILSPLASLKRKPLLVCSKRK